MAKLTQLQVRFVRAFCGKAEGNASAAYKMASPGANPATCRSNGSLLTKKPIIVQAIADYGGDAASDDIADRDSIMRYLSCVMRGEDLYARFHGIMDIKDRTKAAETLVRMQGGFIDKLEVTGDETPDDIADRKEILHQLKGMRKALEG